MASKSSASIGTAKNVTKKHLVDQITRQTGLQKHDVQMVVQGVLDGMIEAVGEGKRIEIRDFGVFEVRTRAARTAQNPKTLEPVHVQPRVAVRFKPGRLMRAALQASATAGTVNKTGTPIDPTLNGHAEAGQEPPMVETPRSDRMHVGAIRR